MITLPIFLFNDFREDSALNVVYSLLYYATSFSEEIEKGEAEIKLYLNSCGGYCTSLMSIIDTIESLSTPVTTITLGQGASCGAVLATMGAKGKRYIGKNSRLLIHQVRGGAVGTNRDIQSGAKETDRINNQLLDILTKNSNLKKAEMKELLEKESFLSAKDALKYGLVDKILEDGADEVKSYEALENKLETKEKLNVEEFKDYEYGSDDKEKSEFISKMEIKSIETGDKNFVIEGMCSVYNNVDYNDDVAVKGFLDKSLTDRGNERPAYWQHGIRDGELPIGKAVFKEVFEGMTFKLELPKNDKFVSDRLMPQVEIGSITDVSFGYVPVRWRNKNGVREILEADIFEMSLVNIGCNSKAKITGFKSIENPIKAIRDSLKESNYSKSERETIINSFKSSMSGEQIDELAGEQLTEQLNKMLSDTKAISEKITNLKKGDTNV